MSSKPQSPVALNFNHCPRLRAHPAHARPMPRGAGCLPDERPQLLAAEDPAAP
jgi:hypothetical protein